MKSDNMSKYGQILISSISFVEQYVDMEPEFYSVAGNLHVL